MNEFEVNILAADRPFYQGPCVHLQVPISTGQYGILAHHRNVIAAIVPGKLRLRTPDGAEQTAAVLEKTRELLGQLGAELWSPDMLMVFNYEEAARGQNPNATRFNESHILSEDILEKVINRGGFLIDAEKLSGFLTISTPLDEEKLDVTQESNLKISTGCWIHCSKMVSLYQTDPQTVLNILADVYWEEFVRNYAENDSILDLSFDELEGMEYLDVKDYLQMQAGKVKNYLPGYSTDSSSFRAKGSGETFASLNEKVENYIDIELERYESFILENGLAKNKETYQSRMQYANRLLDTSQNKDMAAHDVRIL